MTQQGSTTLSHSLLGVFLMLIEALLTLILRFDATLRRISYPLVKEGVVVHFRTYLPHVQFYATFGYKGVFLDSELPAGKSPDVTINAYSHQLFGAIVGSGHEQIDALQIRGNAKTVADLKQFLHHLGVSNLFGSLLAKIRPNAPTPEERRLKAIKEENKLQELKTKLQEQTLLTERLTAENRKLGTELRQVKGTQKSTLIALMVMSVIAFVSVVMHFFR